MQGLVAKQINKKRMKTYLIVAGLLMTGASVYGVVDYNKKAESREFKELYKEKVSPAEIDLAEEAAPIIPVEKKEAAKVEAASNPEKKMATKSVKKKVIKKKKQEERTFRIKEFSRGKMG